MKNRRILLFLFLSLSAFTYKAEEDYWITIYIHGSFSVEPHISIKNAINVLRDKIEDSVYYRSIEICRHDTYFFRNQAMLAFGLQKVDFQDPNTQEAARIISRIFEKVAQDAGTHSCQEYYTFGWSGLVSNKLRYLESGLLYNKVQEKVRQLKADGLNPKVRIIGYSHGGNIALLLGAHHLSTEEEKKISVDELFLFGTPIQTETDYLVNSPLFKKVYNVYSMRDNIQVIDFLSYKRFFSARRFKSRRGFQLPDKLTQIRLRVNEYVPFTSTNFCAIPKDEKTLLHNYRELNFDPGHYEQYLMGWTALYYRQDFPLNPLPVITMIPYLTKYLDSIKDLSNDVVIQIRPCNETMAIYNYNQPRTRRNKHKTIVPFMKQETLSALKKESLAYEPLDDNLEDYNRRMYNSIDVARHEYNEMQAFKAKELKYNKTSHKRPTRDNLTPYTKTISLQAQKYKQPIQKHLHP